MAQFRLSLTLAVSSVLLSALLIASSPSILPHTSLAQSFAAPVATACSTPTGKEEFASGKIQSINGQNLTLLDDQKHLNFNATYASTTYIRQSSIVALSNLKSGKEIIATFTTNANGTATAEKNNLVSYKAIMIMLPLQGDDACLLPVTTSNQAVCIQNACQMRGIIQQFNGNILTVKDDQGKNYPITLTSSIKPIQIAHVTSAALKPNEIVVVTGPKVNGVIAAWSISILTLSTPAS